MTRLQLLEDMASNHSPWEEGGVIKEGIRPELQQDIYLGNGIPKQAYSGNQKPLYMNALSQVHGKRIRR